MERDRDFGYAGIIETRLDNHLSSEFPSSASLVQTFIQLSGKTPQPTVDIVDGRSKPTSRHQREHWIAPPSVQKRHCPRHDAPTAAGHSASLNKIISFTQLINELWDFPEIVTIVRITHNNELTACGIDSTHQRLAITPRFDVDNLRTLRTRNRLRPIGAAVIRNDHLAGNVMIPQSLPCLFNACAHRIRLIEARHDHR